MNKSEIERLQAKTPQQRFLQVLQHEFHYAPKVAEAILEEAQTCLAGSSRTLQTGQIRTILTKRAAGHGQSLHHTATTEVIWTVDAGSEDLTVLRQHGRRVLRQVRIQRLLDEALEQDAVATQEDLARALHVSLRTIKRDCASLQAQGLHLPTRGNVLGIGRGQTHKAHIVARWLQGETYDQITLRTHHSLTSIQRYVQTFVRVVNLTQQGFSVPQIALLLQIGVPLVQEYVAIYRQNDRPDCRERLQAQLQRLQSATVPAGTQEKEAR